MRSATRKRLNKDPQYLSWLHQQQCLITGIGFPCSGPIEAHHAGVRGLSQKAPDETAVPLCSGHHRTGRDSVHVLGRRFWDCHELDMMAEIQKLHKRYWEEN